MQPRGRAASYASNMSSVSKTLLPYRCQFLQLSDGTWMAEDWRIVGLSARGRTRDECRERIRNLILEDALDELGDEARVLALAVSEYPKKDDVVEYLVTGMPRRPISKTTNA